MSLPPDDQNLPVFVSRIREHLQAHAKTPRRLSLEAGLSPDTVAMILNGRKPSARTLDRLGRIVGGG